MLVRFDVSTHSGDGLPQSRQWTHPSPQKDSLCSLTSSSSLPTLTITDLLSATSCLGSYINDIIWYVLLFCLSFFFFLLSIIILKFIQILYSFYCWMPLKKYSTVFHLLMEIGVISSLRWLQTRLQWHSLQVCLDAHVLPFLLGKCRGVPCLGHMINFFK